AGAPTPTPRINAMAGIINGQIAVFGGSASIQSAILPTLVQTEIYDPLSNTWTLGPAMRVAASGMGQGVTFNSNQVFAVGGNTLSSAAMQVLDSSADIQPTITSINPNSG